MDYALDIVSDLDYPSTLVFGADTSNLPDYVLLTDNEIQDQEIADPYGCVFYSGSNCSNTMNYYNKERAYISGTDLCKIAIERGLLDPARGAAVVNSPKLLKSLGYIKTYVNCATIDDIKLSLYNKKPVQTGSNTINRNLTKQNNNIAVYGQAYGHSFAIMGYDDKNQWFICENTYGADDFDKGYFYIKYTDFNLIYNGKYSMTDYNGAKIEDKIREGITLEDSKQAYDVGIWSGANPNSPASRQEVAAMIYRATNK